MNNLNVSLCRFADVRVLALLRISNVDFIFAQKEGEYIYYYFYTHEVVLAMKRIAGNKERVDRLCFFVALINIHKEIMEMFQQ